MLSTTRNECVNRYYVGIGKTYARAYTYNNTINTGKKLSGRNNSCLLTTINNIKIFKLTILFVFLQLFYSQHFTISFNNSNSLEFY